MQRDPVCGMQVDPSRARSQKEFEGQTYYFCSEECRKKFDANPGQFSQ